MKNQQNNIIYLDQWKKHKQTGETQNMTENLSFETYEGEVILPSETNQEFNSEHNENSLSGMLIW